jgi:hypothetical protein
MVNQNGIGDAEAARECRDASDRYDLAALTTKKDFRCGPRRLSLEEFEIGRRKRRHSVGSFLFLSLPKTAYCHRNRR